jgi:hypothetical protein
MRRGARVRVRLGLAAIAIATIAAACAPAAPRAPTGSARLTLNPASLNFPDGNSATMPNLSVTVTNTGGQSAQVLSVSTNNGIFSLPSDTCSGTSLAPGQSCMVTVQFCPGGAVQQFNANVAINTMIGGSPLTVTDPMSGMGVGP